MSKRRFQNSGFPIFGKFIYLKNYYGNTILVGRGNAAVSNSSKCLDLITRQDWFGLFSITLRVILITGLGGHSNNK